MTAACGRRTEMAKKVKIKSKKPQGIGSKIFDVVNYLLLAILGFIMFYPMFYVFIVSISSSQYINQGLVTLFPRGINFDAYKAVFENQRIWSGYKNTFLYTGLGTLICLVLTALCAYPLSRKDFYGRKAFTVLIMITMFVNGGMIPTYLVINKLHMINTMWAIVLPPAIKYLQYDCYENFLPGDSRFLGRILHTWTVRTTLRFSARLSCRCLNRLSQP